MEITPFRIDVPQPELDDLRHRLHATRWPDAGTTDDWSQGVPLPFLRDLVAYWAQGYDWRRFEARTSHVPQFRTTIDGLGIHFLHVRSPHADATPLILTHGWPGSFIEFLDVLEPLTTGTPAFHLVIPSLPGYGFSDRPGGPGWGIERIAHAWAELMRRLGYDRYLAGGGDWGTSISTVLGLQSPEHVIGIHLTPPLVAPDLDLDPTPAERHALDVVENSGEGSAYAAVHRTRPQTIAYSLNDSPTGLAAWMVEKFASWADVSEPSKVFEVLDRDAVLDDVTLYWLTGTAGSSARLYAESHETVDRWFRDGTTDRVEVPTAASIFRDNPRPSRRWAQRRFTDIRYWNDVQQGGHFAAFEQPELFCAEVRAAAAAITRPAPAPPAAERPPRPA